MTRKHLNVYIDEIIIEKLREIKKQTRYPISALIEEALKEYLERTDIKLTENEKREILEEL